MSSKAFFQYDVCPVKAFEKCGCSHSGDWGGKRRKAHN